MPLPPPSTEVRGICEPCYSRQSCCVCKRWECMTCHHMAEMREHCVPAFRRQPKEFHPLRMRHCDTCVKAACHHCLLRCQFCAESVCPTCRPDEGYRYWTCLKCCPWMPPQPGTERQQAAEEEEEEEEEEGIVPSMARVPDWEAEHYTNYCCSECFHRISQMEREDNLT